MLVVLLKELLFELQQSHCGSGQQEGVLNGLTEELDGDLDLVGKLVTLLDYGGCF